MVGCESQWGRRCSAGNAAATPCHGKTREVGEADKSSEHLLLGDESSISGTVGGTRGGGGVVKAGSDGGELPERCRALINHRRLAEEAQRGDEFRGGGVRRFWGLVR